MRVLQSFPEPRATTNPYLVQLRRELVDEQGVTVLTFSWRTALLGRYDVVHLHWPENLVTAGTRPRQARRELLTALWVLRLALGRTPVVRTVHNIGLPRGLNRRQVRLLNALERRTTLRIRLNPFTRTPVGTPVVTIAHGHYRDWLAGCPRTAAHPGRFGYVGQLRRYKGVENLVTAYRDARARTDRIDLQISGKPSSPRTETDLRDLTENVPDVRLDLRHLDDAEMVAAVDAAELVVLPYRFMHNSGTLLYALSLERPVLVPDNEVNRALAEEVGPGWVQLFPGELDGASLLAALDGVRTSAPRAAPDLSHREWPASGRAHLAAYEQAVGLRGRRRARS
jgi:beta-1,4-mannosyltransferase